MNGCNGNANVTRESRLAAVKDNEPKDTQQKGEQRDSITNLLQAKHKTQKTDKTDPR